jgi:PPK2 family polyphosphate:nucleotide phosphotransferase
MRPMDPTAAAARFLVKPNKGANLRDIDPGSTGPGPGDRAKTEAASLSLNEEMAGLQERLWAEHKRALLVVLQAMDAGGKDGTIKKVFRGINPQGCRVTSFKEPSDEERDHDYLWRIHAAAPARGEIGIFNRSHYEDVLIVRVHDLVPRAVWSRRYDSIKAFESELADEGIVVVKLFLHISKEEQAERFRKRISDPEKNWKFRAADLTERKLWDEYQEAYEDALTKTSTSDAPWYVIPADHKWFRDWAVLSVLVATLREMDPRYPPPEDDLSGVVIE